MSKGNLIHIEHANLNATLELLDKLGVSPQNFEVLRKLSSWEQLITARVLSQEAYLFSMLSMEDAARKAGFMNGDFGALAGNEELLRQVRQVLLGFSEIKPIEHVIDCDADPFIPLGWTVEEHKKGGLLKWDPARVKPYFSKFQCKGKVINGKALRVVLTDLPVLNANVLDYLRKNPHLIPEEWKGKYVFFWGTIYRPPVGGLAVRCLSWNNGGWHWSWNFLDCDWDDGYPAALRD